MANEKGRSPYQKYNKAPYRYSALYNEWSAAVRDGRTNEAAKLGKQHSLKWLGTQYEANQRRRYSASILQTVQPEDAA